MNTVELTVAIDVQDADVVLEVRAWIDPFPCGGLDCEQRIPLKGACKLQRSRKMSWRGHYVLPSEGAFMYRVAMVAHQGAYWTLHIRGPEGTLLADSDSFATAKCQIVGSCSIGGYSQTDDSPIFRNQPVLR